MLLLYYVAQQKYHTLKIDIIWCNKYINIINKVSRNLKSKLNQFKIN